MTMSTNFRLAYSMALFGGLIRGARRVGLGIGPLCWQRFANEPEAGKTDGAFVCGGRCRGAGADYRHDVVAADGAGERAEARRNPALQAADGAVLGGVRPRGLARAAAADERDPA